MITVDTDGILDFCERCGARAGVVSLSGNPVMHRAQCSECPEVGPSDSTPAGAAIGWNQQQRVTTFKRDCGTTIAPRFM